MTWPPLDRSWKLWAKYVSFRDAYRNLAFHEQTPESTKEWKVERDKSRIRGWLLLYRTDWGNDDSTD